ncbi:hypothetical protein DFH28DRAFT_887762 [Melampsora americana]|nr:hypothetical protein DFH28DRAFT_887762 [Melampsora americana]
MYVQRNFFTQARAGQQLKFGTSVFHSYVHQWSCQLQYNPRLNEDWGLSDGEGLERIWSKLAPLVGALRYSTSFHRLCALELRTRQINESGRKVSVRWMLQLLSTSYSLYTKSCQHLDQLQTKPTYSDEYLKTQWIRQRDCQLQVMVTENSKVLSEKLDTLGVLEDKHLEANLELQSLRAKRIRNRTEADKMKINHLPGTIRLLEADIDALVAELGGDHYCDMPGSSTPQGKKLIRVRVAKAKLYGAKVDVYETQKKSDERAGTRPHQKLKKNLRDKQTALKTKYETFQRNVQQFNQEFPTPDPIVCPAFDEIRRLSVFDPFWNIGQLTHPAEAWAVDKKTQEGIQALQDRLHAHDELRRVLRESRQSVKWALVMEEKLSVLNTALHLQGECA